MQVQVLKDAAGSAEKLFSYSANGNKKIVPVMNAYDETTKLGTLCIIFRPIIV